MDSQGITVSVNSEIGKLQHVLVHTPGPELEKVTPENAHTFLFSDILNMQVAQKEYSYFKRVLQKAAEVHEIGDLLTDILQIENVKNSMVDRVCKSEDKGFLAPYLKSLPAEELSRQLIEGVRLEDVTYINKEPYALLPIPNLFFMRDASFTMFDNIMIRDRKSVV